MDKLEQLQQELATVRQQLEPLQTKERQLRKQIDAIETAKLEAVAGIKEGDSLIATEEYCNYISISNGNSWPFEIGKPATAGKVHEERGELYCTVYDGVEVGGICIPSVPIELVQGMHHD